MATRVKTVQYAFPMETTLIANNTVSNLTQITLYIPETVIAFRSAVADVGFQDVITGTGGTITEHRVGLRLGSAAYTTVTELDDITHSGENIAGVIGPFDFTSHFTANWSGTSMTCDLQVYFSQSTGTTLGMNNVTALLYVTYEYDDNTATNATQSRTAYLPLESLTGGLPTVANTNFGTNQIPQLTGAGGTLPENSVTIRDYYFVIEANEATNATTDWTMSANIDSGTATAFGLQESGLNSGRYCRWVYKPSAVPATNATHNFQLWASLANKANMAAVMLVVTYEFNAAATTTILNSVMLPLEISTPIGVDTTAEASRFLRDIFVSEPGTITLMQSAFRINFNAAASVAGLSWRAGSQTYRTYTHVASLVVGMFCLQQRIDSGGAQGAGITLARGKNTYTIDGYTTDTVDQMTNNNGVIILNYHSGVPTQGIGAAAHTTTYSMLQWDAALTDRNRINDFTIAIPETTYWLLEMGFIFYQFVQDNSLAITFDVECLTTEGKGGGYYDVYADAYQGDNERANSVIWMRGRDVFKRYPADPGNGRVDVEVSRDYRLYTSSTTSNGVLAIITYRSIPFTVSGTISGSAGGTVTIHTFRSDTNEVVNTMTRTGNGAYSFDWHDDTIGLYSIAYEDGTRYGRSVTGVAGTALNVSLNNTIDGQPVVRAYA